MKTWTVIVGDSVKAQIRERVYQIAIDSIDNALAWEDRVDGAVCGLSRVTGYAVDEDASARLGFEVRKLVFEGSYLIHFRLDEAAGVVEVIHFRHGFRRPRQDEP